MNLSWVLNSRLKKIVHVVKVKMAGSSCFVWPSAKTRLGSLNDLYMHGISQVADVISIVTIAQHEKVLS